MSKSENCTKTVYAAVAAVLPLRHRLRRRWRGRDLQIFVQFYKTLEICSFTVSKTKSLSVTFQQQTGIYRIIQTTFCNKVCYCHRDILSSNCSDPNDITHARSKSYSYYPIWHHTHLYMANHLRQM